MYARTLMTLVALVEIATGIVLLCVPAHVLALLLGVVPDTDAVLFVVCRVAAIAMLALGVASGLSRENAGTGLLAALLLYNVGVAVLLLAYAIGGHGGGLALWPAVVIHAVIALWLGALLAGARGNPARA